MKHEQNDKLAMIDDVIYLGRSIESLSSLIADQSEDMFKEFGVVIPVRSCSLITVLASLQTASASDLAKSLGQSHQLVIQKIPKLLKLGLIVQEKDSNDARRKLFSLTQYGLDQLMVFQKCQGAIRIAYLKMFDEVGDLMDMVARTSDALHNLPLKHRIVSAC